MNKPHVKRTRIVVPKSYKEYVVRFNKLVTELEKLHITTRYALKQKTEHYKGSNNQRSSG